jgi:hypothetical protein
MAGQYVVPIIVVPENHCSSSLVIARTACFVENTTASWWALAARLALE